MPLMCAADMKGGRHALRCKTGGGPIWDTFAEVHQDTGVVVACETRHLLLRRPADVHAHTVSASKGGTL